MNTNEDMLVHQIGEEKCAYGSASGGGHGNNLGKTRHSRGHSDGADPSRSESACYSRPTVTPGRSDGSAFGDSTWTDFAMANLLNRLAQ